MPTLGRFTRGPGVVGCYNFESCRLDESGLAHDLEVVAGAEAYTEIWPGRTAALVGATTKLGRNVFDPALALSGDMSVHALVAQYAPPSTENLIAYVAGLGADNDPVNNTLWQLSLTPASPKTAVAMFWENGPGNNVVGISTSNAPRSAALVHLPQLVSAVREANVTRFYVNRAFIGAIGPSAPPTGGSACRLRVGGNATQALGGLLIANVPHTQADIDALYDQVMAPAFGALTLPAPAPAPAFFLASHNDYLQPNPLFDALSLGFRGVEADVFLQSGELRVAHSSSETVPGRTLQSLYLDPLAALTPSERGNIELYVNNKTGSAAFDALLAALSSYPEFADGSLLVVTEKYPFTSKPAWVRFKGERLAADLSDPHVLDVAVDWFTEFTWTGVGPIPAAERERLAVYIREAHAAGQRFHVSRGPATAEAWQLFHDAGVDWMTPGGAHPPGADDLAGLAAWYAALTP